LCRVDGVELRTRQTNTVFIASAIANGIAGADCKVQTDSCEVSHAANDNGQIGDDVLLDKMDKIVIKVICDVN
jgi:hypothetical protein